MSNPLPPALRAALDAAIEQARKSWDEGGIPIGSALVDAKGTIVSLGHNRRVQKGSGILHAEMDCMHNAGRRRDWSRMTLVSTLSPCPMCTGMALLYRIPRVVIGENKTFVGAEDWMRHKGVEIIYANDDTCVELMERMKRERASLWNEDIGIDD
ncbi:MAG: nucleoside deaminase [Phycisphaerae bacterium]|nr:nucleoside deaminase [Phycisphaerae bacterium]